MKVVIGLLATGILLSNQVFANTDNIKHNKDKNGNLVITNIDTGTPPDTERHDIYTSRDKTGHLIISDVKTKGAKLVELDVVATKPKITKTKDWNTLVLNRTKVFLVFADNVGIKVH